MIYGLLGLLGAVTAGFGWVFFKDVYNNRKNLEKETNFYLNAGFGLVTDFFDTLGIGNFAPTTALFRAFKQVKDRVLPGTLNVSHTIPVVLEAFLFLAVIKVEPVTLIAMIGASVVGAVLGAGFVSRLPEKTIQLVMGSALLITGFFMIAGQLGWLDDLGTGEAIGLTGGKLIIGVAVNFLLGTLMTAGVGLYAPCMALVYMLGMTPKVAFPIMMGSCAFLMPPASAKFVKAGAYNKKAAIGITTGGIFGVLAAVYIVKSLPLKLLTWLVIGVIFITALTLLRAGFKASGGGAAHPPS
ncbi:MAG: sulfite exporter TauE/SafE family protein [Candidatus Aminicenantes bacterium]|nr:sulfite exporter TauE/SafE family protein [Candidatus Aminicenantes bacterium]